MTQPYTIPEETLRIRAQADGMTHLSTGVAVVRDGSILAVRRAADDYLGGLFELPGGGIDPGETFAASVAREVAEETGLRVRRVIGMFPGFEYTTPKKPKVRQFNFLVEADGKVRLSAEHDRFIWVGRESLADVSMTEAMRRCFADAFEAAKGAR